MDLVSDSRTHKLFALKRIVCHSSSDEKTARSEIDFMSRLQHPNLVPCEAWQRVALAGGAHQGALSEFLVIMPYYRVGCWFQSTVVFTVLYLVALL